MGFAEFKITDLMEAKVPALALIDGWEDLAVVTKGRTQTFSYALRNRDSLQTKIRIGERTVYDSGRSLKAVQQKLIPLMASLYHHIDTDHLLAYLKGRDPRKVLRERGTGHKYEVQFDIKKYYDHITLDHIVEMLQYFGATRRGAMLIGRYCVVKRNVNGKQISTLQQGSPVSPIISNLIGWYFFDRYVLEFLDKARAKHPEMQADYLRYSDNSVLFLDGDIPMDFIKEYKAFIWDLLPKYRFYSHKWSVVPENHPKRNQKFLGIVLNKIARIERRRFEELRAILFNAASRGLPQAAWQYFEKNPLDEIAPNAFLADEQEIKNEKFTQIMQGNIAYVRSINTEHADMLAKLLRAARLPVPLDASGRVEPEIFSVLKSYRIRGETLNNFEERLQQAITQKYGEAPSSVALAC